MTLPLAVGTNYLLNKISDLLGKPRNQNVEQFYTPATFFKSRMMRSYIIDYDYDRLHDANISRMFSRVPITRAPSSGRVMGDSIPIVASEGTPSEKLTKTSSKSDITKKSSKSDISCTLNELLGISPSTRNDGSFPNTKMRIPLHESPYTIPLHESPYTIAQEPFPTPERTIVSPRVSSMLSSTPSIYGSAGIPSIYESAGVPEFEDYSIADESGTGVNSGTVPSLSTVDTTTELTAERLSEHNSLTDEDIVQDHFANFLKDSVFMDFEVI